jgi:hypothetical protein
MLKNELYSPWVLKDGWGVRILSGPFSDVAVQINSVEFSKTKEDSLDVDYSVISKPDTITDSDTSSHNFEEVMGVILNDILLEAISIERDEQNRTNDPQESNP